MQITQRDMEVAVATVLSVSRWWWAVSAMATGTAGEHGGWRRWMQGCACGGECPAEGMAACSRGTGCRTWQRWWLVPVAAGGVGFVLSIDSV